MAFTIWQLHQMTLILSEGMVIMSRIPTVIGAKVNNVVGVNTKQQNLLTRIQRRKWEYKWSSIYLNQGYFPLPPTFPSKLLRSLHILKRNLENHKFLSFAWIRGKTNPGKGFLFQFKNFNWFLLGFFSSAAVIILILFIANESFFPDLGLLSRNHDQQNIYSTIYKLISNRFHYYFHGITLTQSHSRTTTTIIINKCLAYVWYEIYQRTS